MSASHRTLALSLLLAAVAAPPAFAAGDSHRAIGAEADLLRQSHHATLRELAAALSESDSAAAEVVSGWIVERSDDRLYLFPPHDERAAPGDSLTNEGWYDGDFAPEARKAFREARRRQADGLMELAARAIEAGDCSLAWDLAHEALRENPDLESVRRMLGYQEVDGVWRRPYVATQLRKGLVWDDRFGWILETRLPRYLQGQRYFQGRWVSVDVEARQRGDIQRGWQIFTENFEIRTNLGESEAVRLAVQLERLTAVWRQAFGRFLMDEDHFQSMFSGRGRAPGAGGRRQVVYFRTRDEYNAYLKPSQPRIEITLGIYFDQDRTAFFFGGADQDAGTVLHEATHQLFQEARRTSRPTPIARRANFWAVEAAACYMESLEDHGGYLTLGGPEAGRTPAAHVRVVRDQFYVPLAELASYGMERLQFDRRIAPLYSQSGGLAAFFMQADGGKRRDAFAAYLAAIYAGSEDPRLLPGIAEESFDELDRAYLAWIAGQTPRAAANER